MIRIRSNRFLGRDAATARVHGVLATSGCDLSAPEWTELSR